MTAEVGWAFHMSKTSMPPLMVGSTRRYSGHLVLTITELPGNLKDPFRRLDTHQSRTRKRPENSGRSTPAARATSLMVTGVVDPSPTPML